MEGRCPACAKPISYRGYCGPCHRAYWKAKKRTCAGGCGREAPSYQAYCGPCRAVKKKKNFAKPGRLCACGTRIPRGYQSERCRDCRSMDNREYREKKKKENQTTS